VGTVHSLQALALYCKPVEFQTKVALPPQEKTPRLEMWLDGTHKSSGDNGGSEKKIHVMSKIEFQPLDRRSSSTAGYSVLLVSKAYSTGYVKNVQALGFT
jgi:hypothetical protein